MAAIEDGFFQDIARITAIIIDQNSICRGYVTPEGMSLSSTPIILEEYLSGWSRITKEATQTFEPYKNFYKKLITASIQTNYAFIDLTPSNLIFINNTYYLIDLESVRRISSLSENFFSDNSLPTDYREEIGLLKYKQD